MTKLQIILLCFAVSLASSVMTTAVALHYFVPQYPAATSASAPLPASPAFTALQSFAAVPQPAQAPALEIKICDGDIAKFCGNDTKKPSMECLQDHFDEVSLSCHKALEIRRDRFIPCKDEIAHYCANAGYGTGRMANCLRQNKSHLSGACTRAVGS